VAGDPWLYAVARVLLVAAVRLYGRFSVTGADNLPGHGPAILVSNHPSDVDPILLGVALPRTLHFMADVVQFRRGFVGPIIRRLGAFPITKGASDPRAMRRALELLAQGHVVALFPEGDLYRQSQVAAFQRGVAMLAVRSGAPVIPAAVVGAEGIWSDGAVHRPRVELRIGGAVSFEGLPARGPGAYALMTDAVRTAVVELHDGGAPAASKHARRAAWTVTPARV
jgi:1-acyl-sn-glycerol-3-phosphate acyltransferase